MHCQGLASAGPFFMAKRAALPLMVQLRADDAWICAPDFGLRRRSGISVAENRDFPQVQEPTGTGIWRAFAENRDFPHRKGF